MKTDALISTPTTEPNTEPTAILNKIPGRQQYQEKEAFIMKTDALISTPTTEPTTELTAILNKIPGRQQYQEKEAMK